VLYLFPLQSIDIWFNYSIYYVGIKIKQKIVYVICALPLQKHYEYSFHVVTFLATELYDTFVINKNNHCYTLYYKGFF
jgi:hypothetical protein